MTGIWSLLIFKDEKAYIFNDYYGLYDVCYYKNNHSFIIGNELKDVVQCIPNLEIDEYGFIMEAFQLGAFPGMSLFKDVYKLKRNEYLKYSKIDGLNVVTCPVYDVKYKFRDIQSSVNDVTSLLTKYAKIVDDKYGKEVVSITGGLDSRLMFGSFYSVGANFTCVHGVSSSQFSDDNRVASELCDKFKVNLEYQNWNQPQQFDYNSQIEVFKEVGFNNFFAMGYKKHYDIFKEQAKVYPFYQAGYFCEAIRLRDWAEKKGDYFSLTDYVDHYYINNKLKGCYSNFNEYRDFIYQKHKEQLRSIGFEGDVEHIPIDLFERFRWEMARFCDSRTVYLLNFYQYTFSLMSIPYIHETILSLPADVIRNGIFQIKVLKSLNPNLLCELDVFSHSRLYKIVGDRKIRKYNKENVADMISEMLPFIRPTLKRIYWNLTGKGSDRRSDSIEKMLSDIEPFRIFIPSYLNINNYSDSLLRLREILVGVNFINNIQ